MAANAAEYDVLTAPAASPVVSMDTPSMTCSKAVAISAYPASSGSRLTDEVQASVHWQTVATSWGTVVPS